MNTSYFFSSKINKDQNLVSISVSPPKNILAKLPNIKIYKPLCPSWQLVQNFKSGKISSYEYTNRYVQFYLNKLEAARVYQELGDDAILLCWEVPKTFCHRHIVSSWFENALGIKIEEL